MLNKEIAQDCKLFDIPIMVIKTPDNLYKIRVLSGGLWITILRISEEDYNRYYKNSNYIITE